MPIYNAANIVKINACINATNNSIALINTINGAATIPTVNDLKINVKQTKLNTKI